jgi:hypothetical protein
VSGVSESHHASNVGLPPQERFAAGIANCRHATALVAPFDIDASRRTGVGIGRVRTRRDPDLRVAACAAAS